MMNDGRCDREKIMREGPGNRDRSLARIGTLANSQPLFTHVQFPVIFSWM